MRREATLALPNVGVCSAFFSVKMSTATKRDHTMLLQPPRMFSAQMSVMVLISSINKALVFALNLDSRLPSAFIHARYGYQW